jgi:hypothetical protein
MPRPRSSKHRPRLAAGEVRALVDELGRLKAQFGRRGTARRKLALLTHLRDVPLRGVDLLSSYHDELLFLRAYPDGPQLLAETERQLGTFADRIEKYRAATHDSDASAFLDRGIVGTPVSNVFSYAFVCTIAGLYPGRIEIDWEAYDESPEANLLAVMTPTVSWQEKDALENDDDFDARAWLGLSRGREDTSSLDALLRLLATSGLSRELQATLYESAEIPVRWTLSDFAASRTGKRVPFGRVFFQQGPTMGRTPDLRVALARPAARLTLQSQARGGDYVRTITEVLGSRCRELFPLIGSNPDEVYVHEPGRGVRIVVYGSLPQIRLPLEANYGLMLVRNGVPIGYGLGAMLFDRCEVAINIFPEYRTGESAFIFERVAHLFVAHFGARVLVIRPYQIGEDNEEALESGAFWFYFKSGFRPVRPRVRTLAEEEWGRITADRSYRSPMKTLKRLAKSDIFFHLDAVRMDGYQEPSAARLGYAVTAFVARQFAGDRRRAERESVRRMAHSLGISDLKEWSADEITGFHRMAPLLACLPEIERWSAREKNLLARIIRAKGSCRERDYARLVSRHRHFRDAVERLANASPGGVSTNPGSSSLRSPAV